MTIERNGAKYELCLSHQTVNLRDSDKAVTSVDVIEKERVALKSTNIWLRIEADFTNHQDRASFYYSEDGMVFTKLGEDYKMRSWVPALPSSTMPQRPLAVTSTSIISTIPCKNIWLASAPPCAYKPLFSFLLSFPLRPFVPSPFCSASLLFGVPSVRCPSVLRSLRCGVFVGRHLWRQSPPLFKNIENQPQIHHHPLPK